MQILVENIVLLVGEFLEPGECGIERFFRVQFNTQLSQARTKCIASGVLAQHHFVRAPAHIFGTHDFVGFAVFEHAVLMDAGFVGKRIGADNGLVGLHCKTGNAGHQARGRNDLRRVDAGFTAKHVLACTHRHDNFFQRSIAGALAQAIDRAFHLTRTIQYRRQRIGHRQTQVIVAVHREHRLVGIGDAVTQIMDQFAKLAAACYNPQCREYSAYRHPHRSPLPARGTGNPDQSARHPRERTPRYRYIDAPI